MAQISITIDVPDATLAELRQMVVAADAKYDPDNPIDLEKVSLMDVVGHLYTGDVSMVYDVIAASGQ